MTTLLSRLQSATGPSRELDAEIALANGWTFTKMKPENGCGGDKHPYWRRPGETEWYMRTLAGPPRYTESIDAALTLVPEGWAWSIYWSGRFGIGAGISPEPPTDELCHSDCGGKDAAALHPAIALLIAIERAKEAA